MLLNILYAAAPWFLASYYTRLPLDQLTLSNGLQKLVAITTEPTELSITKIRYAGVATICLGIAKLSFMHLFVEPLLPTKPVFALYYHWLHPISLVYTLLFGIKVYCLLGVVNLLMGLEQVVMGWNMVTIFNSPILATSPRDFWR